PVVLKGPLDAFDRAPLFFFAQRGGGDHIGVVGGPPADAHLGELPDDGFVADRFAGGCMEDGLTFIGSGPLRPADEILAPRFGAVAAAAGGRQTFYQSLLARNRDWIHKVHDSPRA